SQSRIHSQRPPENLECNPGKHDMICERPPCSVLISHTGGLGDLVLASELVGSIKRAHPDWRVTLACKAELADVASLYPAPPDEVLPLDLDPYRWAEPSPELVDEVRRVIEPLKTRVVDLYLSAEFQPTWFGWLLASAL